MEVASDPFTIFHHSRPPQPAVHPRGGNCRAGDGGQSFDERFVLTGKTTWFLGQIEVAKRFSADGDWHSEEAFHQGVVGGETNGVRVIGDPIYTNRLAHLGDDAQQTSPLRRGSDGRADLLVEPGVHELDQGAVLPQHPECPVSGPGELHAGIDRGSEHRGQIGLACDRRGGSHQLRQSIRRDDWLMHAARLPAARGHATLSRAACFDCEHRVAGRVQVAWG